MRVILGYDVLVENACDPDLDYLEFNPEIRNLLEGLAKFVENQKDVPPDYNQIISENFNDLI
jgi:hypothetical protein